MESGRKLPSEYECPLDDFILKYVVDPINPLLYSLGATPNILTGISGILGLLSVFCIIKSNFILAAFFFALSYIFDCFDGNFARKYNMVTSFGDWFDHIKDSVVLSLVVLACLFKKEIPSELKVITCVIGFVLCIAMCTYLALQQEYYHDKADIPNNEKSNSLDTLKFLSSLIDGKNYDEKLKYIKHAGCGTFNLYVTFMLIYFQTQLKK